MFIAIIIQYQNGHLQKNIMLSSTSGYLYAFYCGDETPDNSPIIEKMLNQLLSSSTVSEKYANKNKRNLIK